MRLSKNDKELVIKASSHIVETGERFLRGGGGVADPFNCENIVLQGKVQESFDIGNKVLVKMFNNTF